MLSRAERRLHLERVCRAGAIAAILALIALSGKDALPNRASVTGNAQLESALERATREPLSELSIELNSLPSDTTIAWIKAIRGAGTRVSWDVADSLAPLLMAVEPIPGPGGLTRGDMVGLPEGPTVLRDEIGMLDSSQSPRGGAREFVANVSGVLSLETSAGNANGATRDSLVHRPVLLLARAGWEGRFTAAALEESGWQLEAEFVVTPRGAPGPGQDPGPGVSVRSRGVAATLDTANYSAVIVLDPPSAARASAIARFVAQGGGLILSVQGATGALSALAPARMGDAIRPVIGGLVSSAPLRGLASHRLVRLTSDAVELEHDNGAPLVAARRHELGRVVMFGYEELWRWRMEGGETAPLDHRQWWSGLVASVAYAPVVSSSAGYGNPAPLAELHATLGPPGRSVELPQIQGLPWMHLLLGASIFLLLLEWTSRRLRGTP